MAFVTCPKLREEACQAGCQVLGPGGGCLPRWSPAPRNPRLAFEGGGRAAAALLPGRGGGELALRPRNQRPRAGVGGCGPPHLGSTPLSLSLSLSGYAISARASSADVPGKKSQFLTSSISEVDKDSRQLLK